MPPQVAAAMETAAAEELKALLADGPWEHSQQLPKHYNPGLLSQPFHALPAATAEAWSDAQAAVLDAAAAHLESAATVDGLRRELEELRAAGEMRVEQECIHDAGGGRGQWRRFVRTHNAAQVCVCSRSSFFAQDPTESGHRHLEDDGHGGRCAKATAPVACGVLSALREAGLPAIRGSYSEIGAGGWLRPHHGMTNGQLKFHLGLVVPDRPKPGCARLRVGGEESGWAEGRVLFFDDSWEHEVHNRCEGRRAVFQVVFLHPQLWEAAGGDWRAAAGFQPGRG